MKLIRFSKWFGLLAILLAFISAILCAKGSDITNVVGVVSTIMSTALGFISIVYTFVSGSKTEQLLDEISRQNQALVQKIHTDAISKNFNDANLYNLRSKKY